MSSGHGGKRAGAGRKAGVKTHNLASLRDASAEAAGAMRDTFNADPRAFLAGVMNRKNLPIDRRMRAAEALLPFCYPKLSASAVVSQRIEGNDPESVIRALNDRIARVTAPMIEATATEAVEA